MKPFIRIWLKPGARLSLIKEGFQVMVYCSDDPIMAKELKLLVAARLCLWPRLSALASAYNPVYSLDYQQANVPVLVDAGVGTASTLPLQWNWAAGVPMNTAIAEAKNPILMAEAMKHAHSTTGLFAGRMAKRLYADPSSPIGGLSAFNQRVPR